MGLLGLATIQGGCASRLDFDHVSSAPPGVDAGEGDAKVGNAEPSARADAGAPLDARAVTPVTPRDAGRVGMSPPDAPDAAPVSAGASDASVSGAAAAADPTTFSCPKVSPKLSFCDDFEDQPLDVHWSVVWPKAPVPESSCAIDGNDARAGRRSLLAQVNDGINLCDTCFYPWAELALPDLQGPSKLTVDFDLRVEQIDPVDGRRIPLFQLLWGTDAVGVTEHTVQLESSGGHVKSAFVEYITDPLPPQGSPEQPLPGATPSEHAWLVTPALSTWVHVAYTLDIQDSLGTANVATLKVDDVVLFDTRPVFSLHNTGVRMRLGILWVETSATQPPDASKTWRLRYDNVLVRYEPR